MKFLPLILLLLPVTIQASCLDEEDPRFSRFVAARDYAQAFQVIAEELRIPPEEMKRFRITSGFSASHDDRNGQADPETLELHLDPDLFLEGKSGACQGIMHEWTHGRQFRRDRDHLRAYYRSHSPADGWTEAQAYEDLQDNALTSHDAAMEIEAILSQIPYAREHRLRDDDVDYLFEHLARWRTHQEGIRNASNETYYLPEIKKADTLTFCQGVAQARAWRGDSPFLSSAWKTTCLEAP